MRSSTPHFSLASVLLFVWTISCAAIVYNTSDEYADLYWHNSSTGTNIIWAMNQTNYDHTIGIQGYTAAGYHLVAVADFDRDGVSDLLWRNESSGDDIVWLMNLDGTRKSATGIQQGDQNWRVVGVYDANNDGWNDIWWRHKTDDNNAIWFMGAPNGTNFVTAASFNPSTGNLWWASAIGDCNNDGYGDIIWRELFGNGRVAIWFMRSNVFLESKIVSYVGGGEIWQPDQSWKVTGGAN